MTLLKYRVTYCPFMHSDLTASDIMVTGTDEEDARREFIRMYPAFVFMGLEQEL